MTKSKCLRNHEIKMTKHVPEDGMTSATSVSGGRSSPGRHRASRSVQCEKSRSRKSVRLLRPNQDNLMNSLIARRCVGSAFALFAVAQVVQGQTSPTTFKPPDDISYRTATIA